MGRAYSEDLRTRALDLVSSGVTHKAVSMLLRIGVSTLKDWLVAFKTEGRKAAKTGYQQGHSHKITDEEAFKEIFLANAEKHWQRLGNFYPRHVAMKQCDVLQSGVD